ncbi:hypothetical protein [Grimontia sp. NTOU-MAR1]|uniref:hypothetical protein n=1 Tax=Grimontia sp. NTOU-MAR1 TaxID=3111011 RepID=UPI002DBF4E1E|nr:hypothetical protein [Grimontia sp. NTOU-MAR1]WRV96282.1 hypothetical protein VP504_09045 [Grimontia sp. NTOU-MAR1]
MLRTSILAVSLLSVLGCSNEKDGDVFLEQCFADRQYNYECDGVTFTALEGLIEEASEEELMVRVGREPFTLSDLAGFEGLSDVDVDYLKNLSIKFSGTIKEATWIQKSFDVENPRIDWFEMPDKEHIANILKEQKMRSAMLDARGGEHEAYQYCAAQAESFYSADCGFDQNFESIWDKDTLFTMVSCKGESGKKTRFKCKTYKGTTVLESYW